MSKPVRDAISRELHRQDISRRWLSYILCGVAKEYVPGSKYYEGGALLRMAIDGTAQTGDIIPCGYDNGWQFCCGLGCCTGSNPPTFRIGNATNIYEDRLECAIEGISTTKASSSSAPTSTSAGAASATTAQPSGGTTTATTIPANDCASSSDDSNTKVVYGAGLGVGLGVPLLLALGLLYLEHRKRIRAEGQLAGIGGASAAPVGATYAPAYSDPKYQPVSSEAAVAPSELQGQSVAQELAAARQYRRS